MASNNSSTMLDADFDSVARPRESRLEHKTANRAKAPKRRPPSTMFVREAKSPSSSMGEDSFGIVANDDAAAAEAVNPGVILKSKSASEVISRSNESLDDYGGGGGLKSSNRTSFKAARQHAKDKMIGAVSNGGAGDV